MLTKQLISTWFQSLQDRICAGLEQLDGRGKFHEDAWTHTDGGGGRSRVLEKGQVIEKGGVNFSAVEGLASAQLLKTLQINVLDDKPIHFFATGVSIVLHPQSPMCPIIHSNIRYFELSNGIWWFGGGIDLTPHYVQPALARDFHQRIKTVCDAFHPNYYLEFKRWADDYFYIKHRKEMRGIGGIFFDRLAETPTITKEQRWEFVQAVGELFVPAYSFQIEQTRNLPFGESESAWQRVRRGRYVEFNLVLDRGTQFGLQTDGRTESILMSLPPQADWRYNYVPAEGTAEFETLQYLKKGIDWV